MQRVHVFKAGMKNTTGGDINHISTEAIKIIEVFASLIERHGFADVAQKPSHDQSCILVDLYAVSKTDGCHDVRIGISSHCVHHLTTWEVDSKPSKICDRVAKFNLIVGRSEEPLRCPIHSQDGEVVRVDCQPAVEILSASENDCAIQ